MRFGRDASKPPTPPPRAVRVSMPSQSNNEALRARSERGTTGQGSNERPANWLKAGLSEQRRRSEGVAPADAQKVYGGGSKSSITQERRRPRYGEISSQESVWGSVAKDTASSDVEASTEWEFTMMRDDGIQRFRRSSVPPPVVSTATSVADLEENSSEPTDEDLHQAVVERDAANRRVENLTSEVVRLASLVKALKSENPGKENTAANIYSLKDTGRSGGSWELSREAQTALFSEFFGNNPVGGAMDGVETSTVTTWSGDGTGARSTKQLFSTVVAVFRRRRNAWWRGIAFRFWLELARWRSRATSVRTLLLSRQKRVVFLRTIHEWSRIARRELRLERAMGKWLERTLSLSFNWWRHCKNGPYVRASDGLRAPGDIVPRPFPALQTLRSQGEENAEYDEPRHHVLISQMGRRWHRKRVYHSMHKWQRIAAEERCLRHSEAIVRSRTVVGRAQSAILQWRAKVLESRGEERGERAGQLHWTRRRREAFFRWRGCCTSFPRLDRRLGSSPGGVSPLAMSPRQASAMLLEDRGRVGALESALQRTEAERSAAASRILFLESQLSEQRMRADQAVVAMNQARREERRMAGEAAKTFEVLAASPLASPNKSVEEHAVAMEQFKQSLVSLLEKQAVDIQQLEHSCRRSAMESSWRAALQRGLRELQQLVGVALQNARSHEEAHGHMRARSDLAAADTDTALEEVEAAVQKLAFAPSFPSPARPDLARADLTRTGSAFSSKSASPIARAPSRPAVADSFGEVWEYLADVLDRVPLHFPGLIGQLLREHLEDMLAAMSFIKRQTWGKADKTLGRLQVNTRLLHVEIARQASETDRDKTPSPTRAKSAHVVVV